MIRASSDILTGFIIKHLGPSLPSHVEVGYTAFNLDNHNAIAQRLGGDRTSPGPDTSICEGHSYAVFPVLLWLYSSDDELSSLVQGGGLRRHMT